MSAAAAVMVGLLAAGAYIATLWLIADFLMADPLDYWTDDDEEGR